MTISNSHESYIDGGIKMSRLKLTTGNGTNKLISLVMGKINDKHDISDTLEELSNDELDVVINDKKPMTDEEWSIIIEDIVDNTLGTYMEDYQSKLDDLPLETQLDYTSNPSKITDEIIPEINQALTRLISELHDKYYDYTLIIDTHTEYTGIYIKTDLTILYNDPDNPRKYISGYITSMKTANDVWKSVLPNMVRGLTDMIFNQYNESAMVYNSYSFNKDFDRSAMDGVNKISESTIDALDDLVGKFITNYFNGFNKCNRIGISLGNPTDQNQDGKLCISVDVNNPSLPALGQRSLVIDYPLLRIVWYGYRLLRTLSVMYERLDPRSLNSVASEYRSVTYWRNIVGTNETVTDKLNPVLSEIANKIYQELFGTLDCNISIELGYGKGIVNPPMLYGNDGIPYAVVRNVFQVKLEPVYTFASSQSYITINDSGADIIIGNSDLTHHIQRMSGDGSLLLSFGSTAYNDKYFDLYMDSSVSPAI